MSGISKMKTYRKFLEEEYLESFDNDFIDESILLNTAVLARIRSLQNRIKKENDTQKQLALTASMLAIGLSAIYLRISKEK